MRNSLLGREELKDRNHHKVAVAMVSYGLEGKAQDDGSVGAAVGNGSATATVFIYEGGEGSRVRV